MVESAQQINEVFGDNPTPNRFIKKVQDFKNEDFIFTAANFYGSKRRKAKLQRCSIHEYINANKAVIASPEAIFKPIIFHLTINIFFRKF